MKRLFKLITRILIFFFLSTLFAVVLYRFVPVYYTPLMFIRCFEQAKADKPMTLHHEWVSIDKISPQLIQAVVASEDSRFFKHNGFDTVEIKKAIKENKRKRRPRGASTISQQTAKNVFLWPKSSWLRKGLEAYFTVLIETFWDKQRIMEVYLNSIEMGDGIYGAQAVANYHFNTNSNKLTREQAATIAATLPNPLIYNSKNPTAYVRKRQLIIIQRMKDVEIKWR